MFEYVSAPYVPYLSDTFTFSRQFMKATMDTMLDLRGPHAPVGVEVEVGARGL